MNIGLIFNIIFYKPLFGALLWLSQNLPGNDLGIAIIVLTCAIRLLIYPLNTKSIQSQKALQKLQPKIQEIQSRFKDDKEKQGKAIMDLYRQEKINPFSGCLPMLIQLPILMALFLVFKDFANNLDVRPMFLGLIPLTEPSKILAVLSGIAQFFQVKMVSPKNKPGKDKSDFSQIMQKEMLYLFPLITVVFLWKLPSAIGIYWLTTSLFSIIQQYLIFKPKNDYQSGDSKN
ncbi:MAG: YidC/Oxa1 family membrane protein insertase [Candidatus Nealsonbacteria bacterium]|nr:YidC/Oxa1 family membrane protein insertase [Candidatus Nealsonbacteria bacterium]